MSVMNRAQFKKQLQDGLNAIFGLEYNQHKEEYTAIFTVENSQKAYEEDVLTTGFGAAPIKQEGVGVAYDAGQESYTARYTHDTVALAFAITEEAVEDNLYAQQGARYSKALARSLRHTKEVKGAAILNRGFDTNYAGGDGKPLFATDHPLAGGGTFANTFVTPAQLSEASLEEALIAVGDFVDDRGLQIAVRVVKLIVPVELQFVAARLLMSAYRPGTSDNDINVINNQSLVSGGYSVNHYLTDSDAWFLKTDCPDGLKHFVRKRLSRGMEGDFETGNLRYKARERYSNGWSDPRGAFASSGG